MRTLSKLCVVELPLPCIHKDVEEAIQGSKKLQFGYCKVKKLMVKKPPQKTALRLCPAFLFIDRVCCFKRCSVSRLSVLVLYQPCSSFHADSVTRPAVAVPSLPSLCRSYLHGGGCERVSLSIAQSDE